MVFGMVVDSLALAELDPFQGAVPLDASVAADGSVETAATAEE
jgi:hypothetical protein